MNAADLNRRIRISKRESSSDALNEPVDTWVPHMDLWAMIRGSGGMGVIRGGAQGVDVDITAYSFRVRYQRPGVIDAGMRVELLDEPGRYFNITTVRHDLAGHIWTDIVTSVGGNDG
jgi:SPP1 family predicted phage head-tail adaptor